MPLGMESLFSYFDTVANFAQFRKRLPLDRSLTAKIYHPSQSDNIKRTISNCHIGMARIFVTAKVGYVGYTDK
jgi:hypothetical protein